MNFKSDNNETSIIVRVNWVTRFMFSIGLLFAGFTIFEFIIHPAKELLIVLLAEVTIDFGLYKLASSYIKINSDYVLVNVPYGTFKIKWIEVRQIKVSSPLIGFFGDDKRVIISLAFGNRKAGELLNIMYRQAEKYKIEISPLKQGETLPITHLNSRE